MVKPPEGKTTQQHRDNEVFEVYFKKDRSARFILSIYIHDDLIDAYEKCVNAKEIWEKLHYDFRGTFTTRLRSLVLKFEIYKMDPKNSMQEHLRIMSSMIRDLSSVRNIGFLLFGDRTQDDILANFDEDLGIPYSSLLDDVVRMSYCLHLMLVFPIVFFSLRLNMDGLLFPHAIPIAYDNNRFYSLTAALVVILFLGANYVPSIWVAFQFTGATATVSVAFIFPAAVALRDRHNIAMKKDRLISMVMIFLAVSSSSVAILSDIYNVFTAKNSEGSGLPFG